MFKKYFPSISIIVFGLVVFVWYSTIPKTPQLYLTPTSTSAILIDDATTPSGAPVGLPEAPVGLPTALKQAPAARGAEKTIELAPIAATSTAPVGETATFVMEGKTHITPTHAGETVFEAMQALASAGAFSFTFKNFAGLGAFIDSIHGKYNADGFYWVYYINGASAQKGVSSIVLSPGDRIEWRYEKGY